MVWSEHISVNFRMTEDEYCLLQPSTCSLLILMREPMCRATTTLLYYPFTSENISYIPEIKLPSSINHALGKCLDTLAR